MAEFVLTPGAGSQGLEDLYRDLHAHPELSFAEHRTADIVAASLAALGYQVHSGIGGTGVVGVLTRGQGPTVLLRADMDALPVLEATGLPYASTARGVDPDGRDVAVMHACGHDVHVTCLLGAAAELAADAQWQGTVVALAQPAEELGAGARAMVADGLYERVPRPDVVLGQHVGPMPAGMLGLHPGPAFATSDSLRVVLHGRGGHGSRPETCVDPIVMAAAVVLRLQTIVAREVAGGDTAVLTVGMLHAGTKSNIIPETAELQLNVRTYEAAVRERILAAIERIVRAEAAASGAPRDPEVVLVDSFPRVDNDVAACERTLPALRDAVHGMVLDPGPMTGSEDVGILATEAGAPCVYWILGGADPARFAAASTPAEVVAVVATLPSNHAPGFAPVIQPTIGVGVAALTAAARSWLARV